MDLTEHSGFTNIIEETANQTKSNHNKSNQIMVFGERGKLEYLGKNLSAQSREPTNFVHMWRQVRKSNLGHIGARQVLSPLHQPCSYISIKIIIKLSKQLLLLK